MRNLLSFFKKSPKTPNSFIALDFGTTSTKAFIFSLPTDDAGLPAGRQVQLLGQGEGAPSEALEQASTQAGVRPEQAVVGIGGENAWCLTTTVRLNRPDPENQIETKEIEKLNEQIFKAALMQATPQMSQFFGEPELTLQLIDSDVLFYKIDGQLVNDPLGKSGKILESSIFTAYSPSTYLGKLSETLKELNLNLWAVSSLMSLFVKALAKENPTNFNAIILDVGGKVTDIAVVFGGGILGTRALSLGGETFTTALVKGLAIDKNDAETKKIAYATHQLRDEEVPKIAEKLQPALDLWLAGVEAALSDFEGIKTFPRRIVLIGGGANLPELKEGLTTYPLMRTLPFASPPTVEVRTDVGPQNMILIAEDIFKGNNA